MITAQEHPKNPANQPFNIKGHHNAKKNAWYKKGSDNNRMRTHMDSGKSKT